MNRAIMAVDPGGHSGIAKAVVDVNAKTTTEAVTNLMHRESLTITGPVRNQAWEIAQIWRAFKHKAVREWLIPPDLVELVCEDYTQRGGQTVSGKEHLSPIMISWCLEGQRMGWRDEYDRGGWGPGHFRPIIWQEPPEVSTTITNQMLRDWGLWVRGREHERSAWKHFCYRVKLIRTQV